MPSTLSSKIESLLFISPRPLMMSKVAEFLKSSKEEVAKAISELAKEYVDQGRGIELVKNGQQVQMTTSGDNRKVIQEFIKDEFTGELTRPSIETLTVVAYRGPMTKAELELIRGVNCSLILRNLMIRGLVEIIEDKARGTLYQATIDMVKYLGVNELTELPDYDKLNTNENLQKLLNIEDDNPVNN